MDKPRKLLLTSMLSPGDAVMLTAAIRDLHINHPFKFITGVNTSAMEIWENNPYITKFEGGWENKPDGTRDLVLHDKEVTKISCHYPLIEDNNNRPYHFIHGYTQFLEKILNIKIPITEFKGDIHLTKEEKNWIPQVAESGHKKNYWIICAGGKYDYTAKWWVPQHHQDVVDHFAGKIKFIQVGQSHHWHPKLRNVIDMVGKTSTRQLMRMVYHADGVLCGVTFLMHLSAAIETKNRSRACVVIAGGREGPNWEAYPQHQFIHTCGALSCCIEGGCWRSRCQLVGDGDKKDSENLCEKPVYVSHDLRIPECMQMISPQDVIRRIEYHYKSGDNLRYLK